MFNVVMLAGRTFTEVNSSFELVVQSCMADRGWNYEPMPAPRPDMTQSFSEVQAFRQEFGYGVVLNAFGEHPNDAMTAALTLEQQAQYGDDLSSAETGCYAAGRQAAYDGIPFYMSEYHDLTPEFVQKLRASPEFNAALDRWSDCMSQRGFEYSESEQATSSFYGRAAALAPDDLAGRDALRAEEMATATADSECYLSEVMPTRVQVESVILAELSAAGRLPALRS